MTTYFEDFMDALGEANSHAAAKAVFLGLVREVADRALEDENMSSSDDVVEEYDNDA